jgi:hypothetical protein
VAGPVTIQPASAATTIELTGDAPSPQRGYVTGLITKRAYPEGHARVNVFELRDRLVEDYSDFTRSFLQIHDGRIRGLVDAELDSGLLWPEPLIQLNPTFEPAETIDELVDEGVLDSRCRGIFRRNKDTTPAGEILRLHRHQADAVRTARSGANYILTTGTGSGKSLAYMIPIVDAILREGPGRGIQAIVVYPMNALANSQRGELEKFLSAGFPDRKGPVTFARYTGQENDVERQTIIGAPPDILLTNYVMLELLLTRPYERQLVEAAMGLRFLVLDELHTYRGRQGADVALLVRRVREATKARALQCVGTSATLAGAGTLAEQQVEIARVASTIFGAEVRPEAVIGETLRRATDPSDVDDPSFVSRLRSRLDGQEELAEGAAAFEADPRASWIETTFGLTDEPSTGRLVRARPRPITGPDGAAHELAELTGADEGLCAEAIRATLLAGFLRHLPDSTFPIFAFRLHQFFGRGDAVYASLEPEETRYLTTFGQQFVPGDRDKILLPLAFCRECGQDYYTVGLDRSDGGGGQIGPRDLGDLMNDPGRDTGFLYLGADRPWPDDSDEQAERVPDDWTEESPTGLVRIKRDRREDVPFSIRVAPGGTVGGTTGHPFTFVPAPFRFCLRCGVAYGGRQTRDLGKLTTLGSGGRSSATSLLSLAAIRSLRADLTLEPPARKLLSFTDNRQDASLQAGHFNDFVEVGLLRSALYRAAAAAPAGLSHEELTAKVADALALDLDLYARDPTVRFAAREDTDKALRDVIGYRLYRDLQRGWRVTSPNLEQSGLLEIRYRSLDELAAADDVWAGSHAALEAANADQRRDACKAVLDFLRRGLAIRVDYLAPLYQDQLKQRSNQRLALPWAIDEGEVLEHAAIAYPRPRRRAGNEYRGNLYLSARGGIGQYLRRRGVLPDLGRKLTLDDTDRILQELLQGLRTGGLVTVVEEPSEPGAVPGYQLAADGMQWVAGDGTRPFRDPVRVPNPPAEGHRTNPFFVRFYQGVAEDGKGIYAKEHTAQVPATEREEREEAFRDGRLPILYCSPTMELGVDIAELNVVNMRNIPPTPANYAQRSGRAGRSGQPALVFNYCTTGSPHDQYFFRRPWLMVSGQVRPPRLELANEDLVRAHVHAIWLAETRLSLGTSLADIVELEGEAPTLALKDSVRVAITATAPRGAAHASAARFLASVPGLADSDWHTHSWLDDVLDGAALAFDKACDRWRDLYRAAIETREAQNRVIGDASRSADDRERAKRLRAEAESQLEILRGDADTRTFQSDFYSYRYFASEGFLPGYSFPRLPLSAYIPGRGGAGKRDEYLSRPRFLAISEFGPRSIVYHEGSRYLINRVMLPAERSDTNKLVLGATKRCEACAYLHPLAGDDPGPDLCRRCGTPLPPVTEKLFRLQNVSTKRRDRINSDEEERQRLGFEIRTGIRFAEHGGKASARSARVATAGETILKLEYGSTATIWRVNVGWRRRANQDLLGFVLDTERGFWQKNDQDPDDLEDAMSQSRERIVPYVEDRRNVLLLEPSKPLDLVGMASLAAAFKNAIQVEYQLEDQELAIEPLPSDNNRRLLLLYESAEGGAGVLRRLAAEPDGIARLARTALEVCHFDPSTGDDRRRAPGAREDCEAACYDCLMSYGNQRDHRELDRFAVRDLLLDLTGSVVESSPVELTREGQLARLRNLAGSGLEREWLDRLEALGLELPSDGQRLIESSGARPDFVYDGYNALVFIDGPVHDQADIAADDQAKRASLDGLGYLIITFRFDDRSSWDQTFAKYPSIFGKAG